MKKAWPVLLVLILSFWAIKPLLTFGFFPIHDSTQIVRVQQMAEALRDGQFPVRWVRDLGYGYGYPLFNFYAPLAYYVGAFFNLIGFNALIATKIMMGLGVLLAGVFMYFLTREFWGKIGGVAAALFYVYAPYHAVDIYVRGSVGEFWAMAFLPLVFYGLKRGSWLISGLAYAAVIFSHNLTAMMLMPIFLAIIIYRRAWRPLLLGLGLSAFYWLPALVEMRATKVFSQIGGGANWQEHFVYLRQLWDSPWGFGGSAPGPWDGMSFMIGKLHLLLAVFAIGFSLVRQSAERKVILGTAAVLLIAIFMTNKISFFIWQFIPALSFIQYPWRFLIFTAAFASFLTGAIAYSLDKAGWWGKIAVGLLILILLTFNIKFFNPQTMFPATAEDYINEENIKWTTSKVSDEYLPRDFPVPDNRDQVAWEKVSVLSGEVKIEILDEMSQSLKFKADVQSPSEILINTAFFPGWRLEINGQEKQPQIQAGKIKFVLPAGSHQITLRFTNTAIRTLANLISLGAWLGLICFVLK